MKKWKQCLNREEREAVLLMKAEVADGSCGWGEI